MLQARGYLLKLPHSRFKNVDSFSNLKTDMTNNDLRNSSVLMRLSIHIKTYLDGQQFKLFRSFKIHMLLPNRSACTVSCFFLADRAAIDAWLERETDSLEFTHAVHPSTGEVFCDCLPDEIRFLLNEFENLMDRVIFNHAFHRCITKAAPGPAKDIKVLFETAKASYDEELDRLTKGL